jgi:SAM-dependent methyltransferase
MEVGMMVSLFSLFPRRRLHFIWRYIRGRTPWDSGIVPPEITGWIEAHESNGGEPGRALDVGCGTGTTSIFLAQHGWHVLGVDFALNAIRRARRKARRQTVPGSVRFESADVSRPDFLDGEPPVDLVVDVGCLHSLTPDLHAAYAANLKRVTRPGATYLLYAFMPTISSSGRRMGLDQARLESLFSPAFDLIRVQLGEEVTNRRPSGWYTFRRTDNEVR